MEEAKKMERKVVAFLQRKGFNLQNQKLVVGVSGGPDSLALLHFLWSQREKWNLQIVAAHVDHMFRGEESAEDALFVKSFCEQRGIPSEMKQIDIPRYMKETGLSSQVAAREGRYAFFQEVLNKYGYPLLALAHHGDDQIETILMRLTRGSTGKARAGIPFQRPFQSGHIVRPFLCLNRMEIEDYCERHHLHPRIDPSNEKDTYSRNRFRKRILPFLKKENPQVHEQFQRFSEDIEEDETFLQGLAAEKMNKVIKKKNDNRVTIDNEAFVRMPLPLQRRGIQLILNYLYQVKPSSLSAIHTDQIFSILKSPHPSGNLDFPNGLKVIRSYEECHFQLHMGNEPASYCIEISPPGEAILPTGDRIILEWHNENCPVIEDSNTYVLAIKEEQLPLRVRTRKDGDRMSIKGMEGTKKLKKIFIDEKIPLQERARWPVVADRFGEIMWLPGLRKSGVKEEPNNGNKRNILITYKRNENKSS